MTTSTTDHVAGRRRRCQARLELSGATAFVCGSIGFIQSSWGPAEDWFRPFQIGCGLWVVGCAFFIAATLVTLLVDDNNDACNHCCNQEPRKKDRNEHTAAEHLARLQVVVSNICELGCQVSFFCGCILGLIGPEEHVVDRLSAVNALFLSGSLLLAINVACTCYCTTKITKSKEVTTVNDVVQRDQGNDDQEQQQTSPSCRTVENRQASKKRCCRCTAMAALWENWDSAIVAASFVFAGILGGYSSSLLVTRVGVLGWTAGSIVSGIAPIRQLMATASASAPLQ